MNARYYPTPSEVALLTCLNIQRYEKERGKEISRFRMARASVRRLAIRSRLEDTFISAYINAMATEYRWVTFINDEEFLFVKIDSAKAWTKIATKRIADVVKRLKNSDLSAISDSERELDTEPQDDEDDEE